MPTSNNFNNVTLQLPIKTYDSASYQISGAATAIAGGTQTSEAAPFTDSVTVTGVVVTDKNIAISPRDAVAIPRGLALISAVVTATNTLSITWKNTTLDPITPPAAGVWSVAVLGGFLKG